jgi:hypothetical protein
MVVVPAQSSTLRSILHWLPRRRHPFILAFSDEVGKPFGHAIRSPPRPLAFVRISRGVARRLSMVEAPEGVPLVISSSRICRAAG